MSGSFRTAGTRTTISRSALIPTLITSEEHRSAYTTGVEPRPVEDITLSSLTGHEVVGDVLDDRDQFLRGHQIVASLD
jgi:hypothetical protein